MSNRQDVRVLIAEDDYLNSEMLKGLLESARSLYSRTLRRCV